MRIESDFTKMSLANKYEDFDQYKHEFGLKVKELQDERDDLMKMVDNSSPTQIIQDEKDTLLKIDQIKEKSKGIHMIDPKDLEDLLNIEQLPFQEHKFTIPMDTLESGVYTMYDAEFSMSVKNDLIGLFKSFSINMSPSDHGFVPFEYYIYWSKNNCKIKILIKNKFI